MQRHGRRPVLQCIKPSLGMAVAALVLASAGIALAPSSTLAARSGTIKVTVMDDHGKRTDRFRGSAICLADKRGRHISDDLCALIRDGRAVLRRIPTGTRYIYVNGGLPGPCYYAEQREPYPYPDECTPIRVRSGKVAKVRWHMLQFG